MEFRSLPLNKQLKRLHIYFTCGQRFSVFILACKLNPWFSILTKRFKTDLTVNKILWMSSRGFFFRHLDRASSVLVEQFNFDATYKQKCYSFVVLLRGKLASHTLVLCCVFRAANGYSSRRSLVEIDFLTLKQIFLSLTEQNKQKM